ncbi:MAG: MFS transporter [Lachnospiraceae bacterium]|nr:MFS transporter [Lachnospiraceae bacterium]
MRKANYTGKLYIGLVVGLIMIVQFADSYSAELFSKIQSFVIGDFFIKNTQLDMEEAVSRLGYMMLPFYIVPALSPLARIFVDRYGKKRVMVVNLVFLAIGCGVCGLTDNIWVYLLGNGLVTFATSIDIQNIYIAQDLPEKRRATVRGILSGVTAVAAMLIPVCRGYFVNTDYGWRGVYGIAILVSIIALFVVIIVKENKVAWVQLQKTPERVEKSKLNDLLIKKYLLILFFIGIATSGITMYNEPILANLGYEENAINQVLLAQPIALLIINIIIGIFADRYERKNVAGISLSIAIVFLLAYVIGSKYECISYILGIFWGGMVGAYFSAVNILFLVLMENAKDNNIGKISAISAYINGAGNAVGIVICTVLVKVAGMEIVKISTAIPVLLVAIILLLKVEKFNLKES